MENCPGCPLQILSSTNTSEVMQCTFGSPLAEATVGRDAERIELVQPGVLADGALGLKYLATQTPRICKALFARKVLPSPRCKQASQTARRTHEFAVRAELRHNAMNDAEFWRRAMENRGDAKSLFRTHKPRSRLPREAPPSCGSCVYYFSLNLQKRSYAAQRSVNANQISTTGT